MKRRVANVVPSECGGEENEQVECIVTDVFLRRLIIDLHCLNLVLIALGADVFFWVIGKLVAVVTSTVPCSGCLVTRTLTLPLAAAERALLA